MLRTLTIALIGLMSGLSAATNASANVITETLTVDGGFGVFIAAPVGGVWDQGLGLPPIVFNFTATTRVALTVTDTAFPGDRFAFSINGGPSFVTSVPGATNTNPYPSTQTILADDLAGIDTWSHLTVFVGPGTYDVTGTLYSSPLGGTSGAIEVTSAVPEPASLAIFGIGLFGLLILGRRRSLNWPPSPKSSPASWA